MQALIANLVSLGISEKKAAHLTHFIEKNLSRFSPEQCWQKILPELISEKYPFACHLFIFQTIYSIYARQPKPAWFPDEKTIQATHIKKWMDELGISHYADFHQWSVNHYTLFWEKIICLTGIRFDKPYHSIVDLSQGITQPCWFPGGKLNIVNSCFQAKPSDIAIFYQAEQDEFIKKITYAELHQLSNRVAHSIQKHFKPGDRLAIIMPMNIEAVAIYLGIIQAGCCVVSIADSFSSQEIALRLRLSDTKAVFTQDKFIRHHQSFDLYQKILSANTVPAIVLGKPDIALRENDQLWENFLAKSDEFQAIACDPQAYTHILFSSGTTGEPKLIPWTHTTPIKCSADAYLHLNIEPQDILCWPTNLGWMMGPWLIYAALINRASIALFDGTPNIRAFGEFVQNAKVTCLGVVPTLVKTWRVSRCMENIDWTAIKCFSSSGECSNEENMLYLMHLAHYRPVIEYCGGTEIGGAYITGTLLQPAAPGALTTPALGLDFVLLNEKNEPANQGEVALIPPSIGLSTTLVNKNHDQIYFADMPTLPSGKILRRHGDAIEKFENGFYQLHGRADDTMNLSGIKISAVEIEAVINRLPEVFESAAIAISPPDNGPSLLMIYVSLKKETDLTLLKTKMQQAINQQLNPLFKIYDVKILDPLPKTASNKIMRRELRDHYAQH